MAPRFQFVGRLGYPAFLDLPWSVPLEDWEHPRIVDVARGVARHVVRFFDYEGTVYALKETTRDPAQREYRILRELAEAQLPVVDAVGVVMSRTTDDGDPLGAVLITQHLPFSLPYRYLFAGRGVAEARTRLIDALALLLVRLHLEGFFWGDCSLSNTLFRRDAGALAAYLVDAETAEHHTRLSTGQRRHDLEIARENVAGELLDLAARGRFPSDADPVEVTDELEDHYGALWDEITREEVIAPDERFRVDERLRRLNELGFDVEEFELERTGDGDRMRVQVRVAEEGHHRRHLARLVGLEVQENQARRLLNDMDSFRADNFPDQDEEISAHAWVSQVFEPIVRAIQDGLGER